MFRNIWLSIFLCSLLILASVDHADAQPPVLEQQHFPNPVADVSAGNALMPVEITYTAPGQLVMVRLVFTSLTGEFFSSYHTITGATSGPERALRGTSRSGSWLSRINIPSYRAAGPWVISVMLGDALGNTSYYGPGVTGAAIPEGNPPLPVGSTTGITLINPNPPDETLPELDSLTISPAVVDVTAGQQTVTVNATASDVRGVSSVWLDIYWPDGRSATSLSMTASQLVSGDTFSGTYQSTLTIPPDLPPGPYAVRVYVTPDIGRVLSVGFPDSPPAPAGVQTTLEIQNTGPVDSSPPALLSISTDRSVVDVTEASQRVNFQVAASGGLSGIGSIGAELYRGDGTRVPLSVSLYADSLPPYEALVERQNIAITVPRYLAPGHYHWRVSLSKAGGISPFQSYGQPGDTPFPGGFTGALEIINSGMVGSNPPVITNLAVTPDSHSQYDGTALVEFTVEAMDNLGVTGIQANLRSDFQGSGGILESAPLQLIQGTAQSGTWRGRGRFPGQPGSYWIQLTIQDTTGNVRNYQERFDQVEFKSEKSVPIPEAWPSRFTVTNTPSGLPVDPYSVWRRGHSGLAGPQGALAEDPDGDGIPNGLEFICGTDPLLPSLPGGPDPGAYRAPRWTGDGLELEESNYNFSLGLGLIPVLKGWKSCTLAPGSWVPVSPQLNSGKQKYLLDPPGPNRRQQFLRLTVEP